MPQVSGPGSHDPFDPWDVEDVLERVVRPIVASLIRPADVRRVEVGWGPRESAWWPFGRAEDELWLLVATPGSVWHSQIWQLETADQLATLGAVAQRVADAMEDWVCEDVYWGEQAMARVLIPARAG